MLRSCTPLLLVLGAALVAVANPESKPIPEGGPVSKVEPPGPLPEGWDYVGLMKKVAAKFRGNEGVVIHVGGSMTIANPYGTWPRSGKGKTPEDQKILEWMHTEKKDNTDGWWLCRTEVKPYRAYTSESGLKS